MTNTMQLGSDNFHFRKQILNKLPCFDLTRETSCTGFNISATQPDNTNIRIIFEIDDKLFFFNNGELIQYRNYGRVDDILREGNTIAELLALDGIVQFVGKRIFPIVALDYDFNAEILPTINMTLNVSCYLDEYARDELSPTFELTDSARIVNCSCTKSNNGYATADAFIRLRNKNGEWSDWLEYPAAIGKDACAVQFKNHYVVTTLDGSDEAGILNCNIDYVTDTKSSAGDVQEIILKPVSYEQNLNVCYALIKHSELLDAQIKAYVKYSDAPKKRENIIIGTGTGTWKTYYLGINGGIDRAINQNTLHITAGGVNLLDFFYNTENATVNINVAEGVDILASYEYDISTENWLEMSAEPAQVYDSAGTYSTRFIHRTAGKKISSVKVRLARLNGKVENEVLGIGNAQSQTFALPHRAKIETIQCTGNWIYDEDTQILKVTADRGEEIKISYDWTGTLPKVDSIIAGWTA